MTGPQRLADAFKQSNLSDTYWIHRTRRNFLDKTPSALGEDSFIKMAEREIRTIDRIVSERMKGSISSDGKFWIIPQD